MGISLDCLDAFVTAAEAGSFSAAARRLGKAQSRVSTAIGNLEIDLGVTLFDRRGRYPCLTPEGEALLREARQILARVRGLADHADILAGGVESRLRIALDELVPPSLLADILGEFRHRFPVTELEFLTGVMGDVSEMVVGGRADFGIEIPVAHPDERCEWRHLGQLEFVVVAAASHPLASLAGVDRGDLESYLQLSAASRGGERDTEAYALGKRVWYFDNSQIIRELLLRGEGWGALAEYQVREDIRAGRLVRLPLSFGTGLFTAGIYLVHERGGVLRQAALWFADAFAGAVAS